MKPDAAQRLTVVPVTLPVANKWVKHWHRHHDAIPGGFGWFCVACVNEANEIVGVAIAGRPTNRNNYDNGQTIEVLRVATDGTMNAPSALLGAVGKAARAIGAAKVITYTLDSESGASLRGAGWRRCKDGIKSWWDHPGKRTPAVTRDHFQESKVRWELDIRPPVTIEVLEPSAPDTNTLPLWDEGATP